jgi:hypothetical protein
MPALDQDLDQLDDLGNGRARQWLVIGSSKTQQVGVRYVRRRHLAGELFARDPLAPGRRVDLVVDIRDVCYECHDVALALEKPFQQRKDNEGSGITDVDATVNSRTAGVYPHPARLTRLERAQLSGSRVMQRNRAQDPATLAAAGASALACR